MRINGKRFLLVALCLLAVPGGARAAVEVFACEPEWAALVTAVGGGHVEVFSATTAKQDVHHIQARPGLIARARRADLLVCTGAGLEAGWLPVLLRRAANPRIRDGAPGHLMLADHVALLDRPQRLDRAGGDVHPQGNPHIQLDPHNILQLAPVLAARLSSVDPGHANAYRAALEAFLARWRAAIADWQSRAAPLQGIPVVVHHNAWVYLSRWLGLQVVGMLEPQPGVPPSSTHLAGLLRTLEAQPARVIIRAPYQPSRASAWLAERSGIPATILPSTVGGTPGADDLFGLFDDILRRLLEAVT